MASFEDYKTLRNKVRKYETLSLVLPCIKKLHEISKKPVYDNGGYYPWHLLYLIKVAFLEGGKNGSKIATTGHINAALNQINDLGNESRFLNCENGGVRKFLRTQAFQQFWFQRPITSRDMARRTILPAATYWLLVLMVVVVSPWLAAKVRECDAVEFVE